jgi:hypothetical protein
MMSDKQIAVVKFLLDSGKSESDVFRAFNLTHDEWITLKTGTSTTAMRLQMLTQPKQMPTSKEVLAAKDLPDKPTPPPKTAWSGWGTDPNLAASNVVREFERAHGMECGSDPDQNLHKGMSDRLRRR